MEEVSLKKDRTDGKRKLFAVAVSMTSEKRLSYLPHPVPGRLPDAPLPRHVRLAAHPRVVPHRDYQLLPVGVRLPDHAVLVAGRGAAARNGVSRQQRRLQDRARDQECELHPRGAKA